MQPKLGGGYLRSSVSRRSYVIPDIRRTNHVLRTARNTRLLETVHITTCTLMCSPIHRAPPVWRRSPPTPSHRASWGSHGSFQPPLPLGLCAFHRLEGGGRRGSRGKTERTSANAQDGMLSSLFPPSPEPTTNTSSYPLSSNKTQKDPDSKQTTCSRLSRPPKRRGTAVPNKPTSQEEGAGSYEEREKINY